MHTTPSLQKPGDNHEKPMTVPALQTLTDPAHCPPGPLQLLYPVLT